jgi:uncharacterized membrane protein HdeD (DUF308 family)
MRARETSRAGFSHVCAGDAPWSSACRFVISLVAIASGILVLIGMFGSRRMPGWTAFFLLTTVLTSVAAALRFRPVRDFSTN